MKLLLKFLFHRSVLVGTAILIQMALLIFVIWGFKDYFVLFYFGSVSLSIIAVLIIINNNMNSGYKIAWIIPILLFPIFGGLFYIFFGGKKLSKRVKRKMNSVEERTKTLLGENSAIAEIETLSKSARNQALYIQNSAYYPAYVNAFTEYFPSGELKFERLKAELRKAERFIFMEYFIIEEGLMWNEILEILVEKAKAGVDVRVMYDDMGCLFSLPRDYDQTLRALGIKCCIFNPIVPVLSSRLNNRDHRKITVIDGDTGFTGGVNLADEYINAYSKYGHWKDAAIMIKGEAVWSLTVMFLSLWDYVSEMDTDYNAFKPEIQAQNQLKGFVQPFTDSPLDDEAVGETVYLNIINRAERYVYITTPYLIIDGEMTTALCMAAKSGVDVKILTPGIGDSDIVHVVTRSYYPILLKSGVKIYEYVPGFIHSKTFVSDDEYGVVGTINLDYRSLYLHYEDAVWLYKTDCIMDIKADFLETLKLCKEISFEESQGVAWYKLLGSSILRVFAPLL